MPKEVKSRVVSRVEVVAICLFSRKYLVKLELLLLVKLTWVLFPDILDVP
jgi:hypothetical protein